MALAFHEANCVVVGTFNIYIVRPDWLGRVGLLPEGSEVKFETQLTQPGFRLQSPSLGATWIVSPDKLILETDDPHENCGATVDRILEILPWTPLMALGSNVVYRGQYQDIEGWNEKTVFPPAATPEGFQRKQRSWHIAAQRDDQIFNLQLSEQEGEYVEVRANVHTELRGKDVDFARETARQYFNHRKTSLHLIQTIFNASIDHADVNGD